MRALQRLFEKYPKWIGKVQLVQVAVPSRTDVVEYKVSQIRIVESPLIAKSVDRNKVAPLGKKNTLP